MGVTEDQKVDIYAGTCGALEPTPLYALEPVVTDTMSSVTTLDVGFEELTNGGLAIAIRASADAGEAVLACNEIPTQTAEAVG